MVMIILMIIIITIIIIIIIMFCIQRPPSLQAAKKVRKDAEGRLGLETTGRPRRRIVGAHR